MPQVHRIDISDVLIGKIHGIAEAIQGEKHIEREGEKVFLVAVL